MQRANPELKKKLQNPWPKNWKPINKEIIHSLNSNRPIINRKLVSFYLSDTKRFQYCRAKAFKFFKFLVLREKVGREYFFYFKLAMNLHMMKKAQISKFIIVNNTLDITEAYDTKDCMEDTRKIIKSRFYRFFITKNNSNDFNSIFFKTIAKSSRLHDIYVSHKDDLPDFKYLEIIKRSRDIHNISIQIKRTQISLSTQEFLFDSLTKLRNIKRINLDYHNNILSLRSGHQYDSMLDNFFKKNIHFDFRVIKIFPKNLSVDTKWIQNLDHFGICINEKAVKINTKLREELLSVYGQSTRSFMINTQADQEMQISSFFQQLKQIKSLEITIGYNSMMFIDNCWTKFQQLNTLKNLSIKYNLFQTDDLFKLIRFPKNIIVLNIVLSGNFNFGQREIFKSIFKSNILVQELYLEMKELKASTTLILEGLYTGLSTLNQLKRYSFVTDESCEEHIEPLDDFFSNKPDLEFLYLDFADFSNNEIEWIANLSMLTEIKELHLKFDVRIHKNFFKNMITSVEHLKVLEKIEFFMKKKIVLPDLIQFLAEAEKLQNIKFVSLKLDFETKYEFNLKREMKTLYSKEAINYFDIKKNLKEDSEEKMIYEELNKFWKKKTSLKYFQLFHIGFSILYEFGKI